MPLRFRSSLFAPLLVLLLVCASVALPAPASASTCINCYGHYCGDRTLCCGASGQLQAHTPTDTPPCDDLDALCKAHDECRDEHAAESGASGTCVCDRIMQSGLSKAASNASFVLRPECAISSSAGGGCKDTCEAGTGVFNVATAPQWLGLSASSSCTCLLGTHNGSTVTDVMQHCPEDERAILEVTCKNMEAHFMQSKQVHAKGRRLLSTELDPGTSECASVPTDVSADASACAPEFMAASIALIPDACGCRHRDLRCLMEAGVYTSGCRSHVENLLRCESPDPQLAAVRAMVASRDFGSVSFDNTVNTHSTAETIGLVYWLPILVVLLLALVAALLYGQVRTRQYQKRIAALNSGAPSGRSTGFSLVNGPENTWIAGQAVVLECDPASAQRE